MKVPDLHRSLGLAAAFLAASATGPSAQTLSLGEKTKLEGIITSRAGDSMTVKTDHGNVVARLTENTDVRAKKGRLGLIKKEAAATALIPGLKVGVEGVGDDQGQLIATKVSFTSGDLKTARAIQAGLTETESQVAANREGIEQVKGEQADLTRRFGQLGDYDVRAEATVYFAVGSAAIPAEGAQELAALAAQAKPMQGYMVGVEGYADASGSADLNQKLSLERSQAVVNWLAQNGGIPFFRMLAPGAMSTAAPAASNESASGRAQNRRVVVKVLVNRGIAAP
ncbi:MAG TPA: OmpA family protein [Vicinamibacteria bacterium]|nr:OmpA family protein [Vicinamibacteria bacterium]